MSMKWEFGYIKFISDNENNSCGKTQSLVKAMSEQGVVTRRLTDTYKNKWSLAKADGPFFNVVEF